MRLRRHHELVDLVEVFFTMMHRRVLAIGELLLRIRSCGTSSACKLGRRHKVSVVQLSHEVGRLRRLLLKHFLGIPWIFCAGQIDHVILLVEVGGADDRGSFLASGNIEQLMELSLVGD